MCIGAARTVESAAGVVRPRAVATGIALVEGNLSISVESDLLVAFGDGIEADTPTLSWGQRVTVG